MLVLLGLMRNLRLLDRVKDLRAHLERLCLSEGRLGCRREWGRCSRHDRRLFVDSRPGTLGLLSLQFRNFVRFLNWSSFRFWVFQFFDSLVIFDFLWLLNRRVLIKNVNFKVFELISVKLDLVFQVDFDFQLGNYLLRNWFFGSLGFLQLDLRLFRLWKFGLRRFFDCSLRFFHGLFCWDW